MSVAGFINKVVVPNGGVYNIKDIAADNYLTSSDVRLGYHDNSIWLSSKSYVTSVDCSGFGGGGSAAEDDPPYRMAVVQLESAGENGLSCSVADRTVSTIAVSQENVPVSVYLPTQNANNVVRDFMLRIEISSATVPSFTFLSPDESIDFDSDDSEWYILQPGVNIIQFTETKRGNVV